MVIFDQFVRTSHRANSNMLILGTSGMGKSSLTKKLAIHHLSNCYQTIIIDPESEYSPLLRQFGGPYEGAYYALGGDGRTKFNPLQIQAQFTQPAAAAADAEAQVELSENNKMILQKHISWFGNWMKILFPELTEFQKRFLERHLRALY